MASPKHKKTRNLLLLVLLLVVLLGAYFAMTNLSKEKEEDTEQVTENTTSTTLVEMEKENVAKLEYQGQNSSMTLVCEDGTWYREDDREFPVNQSYAASMCSLAAGLTASKTVNENPERLEDYGLGDDAKVWVRVTDIEGNSVSFHVGIKSPGGDGCYVSVNDEKTVYLATTSLLTQYQYTENQMIAKQSTPTIESDNITYLLIEKPEGNVELSLEPGNEMDTTGYSPWLLKQGFSQVLPGNGDTIKVLAENYTSFPLGDCVNYSCENPTIYGLDTPTAHLSLIYAQEEETGETDESGVAVTEQKFYSFGFTVGAKDETGSYYIQMDGSDSVYLMDAETVDTMIDVDPYKYVSRLPGLVNVKQVDQVTIEYGSTKHVMSLTRTMETTTDADGNETEEENLTYFFDGREVKKSEFGDLYQQMIGVKIDGLVDEEVVKQNSSVPVLKFTFDRTSAGLAPVVTEFYSYNDNFSRISVDGMSFFRVNIRDVESLITTFEEIFAE